MEQKGFITILSSPSGAGKSVVSRAIVEKNKNAILSISYTTRKKTTEENSKDYRFISKKEFEYLKQKGEMAETTEIFGNCYGTSKSFLQDNLRQKKNIVLDVDWRGKRSIKKIMPQVPIIDIFLLPPRIKDLEERLLHRKRDSRETVKLRMLGAKKEISHYDEYSWVVVNKDLNKTIDIVQSIITSESNRRNMIENIDDFARDLLESYL